MKVTLRTFVFAAIVLTLVALPAVALAAGEQPVTAAVSTALTAAGETGLGYWPPPPPPPGPPPGPPPPYPPPHCGAPCPPPPPRPPMPPPPPPPVYYPTPTPAPAQPVGANIGGQLMTKVIGDPHSATIYAYTNAGWLYRSDTNGSQWHMVVTNPAMHHFLMSASDPNILYSGAGPNCGSATAVITPMYKSEDGGETWTELSGGLGLKPMLVDPSDASKLFAADCTTLYLSSDGGQTWAVKPNGPADNIWETYTLTDLAAGSTWDEIYGVGNDAQGQGVVAFTGDQGGSFSNITDPNQVPQNVSAVLPSPTDSGKLWVASGKGVWASADYGVNWSLAKAGLEYLIKTNTAFNDLAYGQNGSLYLATQKGLYIQSEPDGVWKLPNKDDVNFGVANMRSLLITESNPSRLWINSTSLNSDDNPVVYTMVVK